MLDRADIPFHEIERNMSELNFINKHLGGHAITLEGFQKVVAFFPSDLPEITICEIGCGGGDNLRVINDYCAKHHIRCNFIGIDINDDCIQFAKKHSAMLNAEWITSDYKNVRFIEKPDIIFNSLFCHHFNDEELHHVLCWMRENASHGCFVNDLHRNPLAYYSIKILTRIFSRSELVRNDAPLSVLRGFSKVELERQLRLCGIDDFTVDWKWAFRWLIVFKNYE